MCAVNTNGQDMWSLMPNEAIESLTLQTGNWMTLIAQYTEGFMSVFYLVTYSLKIPFIFSVCSAVLLRLRTKRCITFWQYCDVF